MRARSVAVHERGVAQSRLVMSYADRARLELAAERPQGALAFAEAAAGIAPLEASTRFVTARALEALPQVQTLPANLAVAAEVIPGTRDVVVVDRHGVRRWSPELGLTRWRIDRDDKYGELVIVDATKAYVASEGKVTEISLADGTVIATMPSALSGYIGRDLDGKWLAIPTMDDHIDLFDAATRTRITRIPHTSNNTPLISPDGQALLVEMPTGDRREQVMIGRAGKRLAIVADNSTVVTRAGSEIVFARRDGGLRGRARVAIASWTGQIRLEIPTVSNAEIVDIAYDAATNQVALSDKTGAIELRDAATGALRARMKIDDLAFQTRFDRQGRLWTISRHAGVFVHDAASGVRLAHWSFDAPVYLSVTDDASWIAVLRKTRVVAWPVELAARVVAPTSARIWRTAFTADHQLVTAGFDGVIGIFDRDGREKARWQAHAGQVSALQLVANGVLLTASRDDEVALWNLADHRELLRLKGAGFRAEASPDGQLIATGGTRVKLWDRQRAAVVQDLGPLTAPIRAIHWTHDGTRLAAIDEVGVIKIWERTGTLVRVIDGLEVGVRHAVVGGTAGVDFAFSPDGRTLVRAGRYERSLLFAVEPGQRDRPLFAFPEGTSYSMFFVDGGTSVYMSGEGFVGRWSALTGTRELYFETHPVMTWVRPAPDAPLLFGGGTDGKIHVWDLEHGIELSTFAAPDEVYHFSLDGDRLAAATVQSTLLVSVSRFDGDLSTLRELAACRAGVEVRDGQLQSRPIAARCTAPVKP